MKVKLLFFFIFCFVILPHAFALFSVVPSIDDTNINQVVVSPFNTNIIYVASGISLFKSDDDGNTFTKINAFVGEDVNHIFFDPYLADTLYVVTSRNVFRVNDTIEKIFSAKGRIKFLSGLRQGEYIFIGTTQGAYYSQPQLYHWKKLEGLQDSSIYSIDADYRNIFFATSKGVYIKRGDDIERTFVAQDPESDESLIPQIIVADIFNEGKIWLGTTQGLFISDDNGQNWKKLYIAGIDSLSILCVAQTPLEKDTVYLGTTKGFFRVDTKKNESHQIFEGLSTQYIPWVAFTKKGEILLATFNGLFRSGYFTPGHERRGINDLFEGEPDIIEIQRAAMLYNEVHPEKIAKWRKELKVRALFPEISLDYDKTVTTALGATYDKTQVGPRDWGINFKWDVGDLVWNTYQDDVDTRSRLNTQLRVDILNEINRVFFERLRLKREIYVASLSDDELFQKELRLQELTAILDGYTGGYFSKKLQENKDG